jgi:hypothetical protein
LVYLAAALDYEMPADREGNPYGKQAEQIALNSVAIVR